MIVQEPMKLKIKEIERISSKSECLPNLYYSPRFPTLRVWWAIDADAAGNDLMAQFDASHRMHGGEIAKNFGTPNCNMKGYESYPGAWVFYDIEYDVDWLVFSDGIRKGCFKGTSYEVKIPDDITEDQLKEAIRKFFAHFGYSPMDEKREPI